MRKLSNYVEIIKTDMGYLLFNKLNEMIVEFDVIRRIIPVLKSQIKLS